MTLYNLNYSKERERMGGCMNRLTETPVTSCENFKMEQD